jgi:hypothetical protein
LKEPSQPAKSDNGMFNKQSLLSGFWAMGQKRVLFFHPAAFSTRFCLICGAMTKFSATPI